MPKSEASPKNLAGLTSGAVAADPPRCATLPACAEGAHKGGLDMCESV